MTSKEFGASLRRWRETRGWTQAEVAQRLSLGASTVAHLEAGSRNPSWDVMQRYAALFDARVAVVGPEEAEELPSLTEDERQLVRGLRMLRKGGPLDGRRAAALIAIGRAIHNADEQVLDGVLFPIANHLESTYDIAPDVPAKQRPA